MCKSEGDKDKGGADHACCSLYLEAVTKQGDSTVRKAVVLEAELAIAATAP